MIIPYSLPYLVFFCALLFFCDYHFMVLADDDIGDKISLVKDEDVAK